MTLGPVVADAENPVAGSRVYKLHAQNGSHEYGTSDGTVSVAIASLLATPMAVNIHRSGDHAKTYVAGADLQP